MASLIKRKAWGPWPDRVRLPLAFDPPALAADLAAIEAEPWTRHFVHDNYEGEWTVLPLRAPAGETHPIRMIGAPIIHGGYRDTPLLGATAAFAAVLAAFSCPIFSARLMRLGPGSTIREHRDPELLAEDGFARIHVPVATSRDVDFRLAGTRVEMEAGTAWYLRLSEPHSVHNRGATARVHLVFDTEVNDWLAALLDAGS